MTDEVLADEIIRRLNGILQAPGAPEALYRLMGHRLELKGIERKLGPHPTIQVDATPGDENERLALGWLGLLNGIVGAIPAGPRRGWGYIAAVTDDDAPGCIVRFERVTANDLRGM